MHVPAGVNNHFQDNIWAELSKIDSEARNYWRKRSTEVMDELDEILVNQKKEFEAAKRKVAPLLTERRSAKNILHDAKRNKSPAEAIRRYEDHLKHCEKELEEFHQSDEGTLVDRYEAAKEMQPQVKAYFDEKKRKHPCGEAEFLFTKALPLYGARYRAEHGGFELSHSDNKGMTNGGATRSV